MTLPGVRPSQVKLSVTTLAFCVAALLALGMVMLYSATMTQAGAKFLLTQMLWCALGLVACVVVARNDYRLLMRLAVPLYLGAVLLLVLVLVRGVTANGARRWLDFGIRFQPSEFAKLALIVVLAWYGARYARHMPKFWRGMMLPGAMVAVVMALIFLEPDVGTTILVGAVSCVMLLVAGIRWRYLLPPALVVAAGISLFIWHNPTRSDRIYSWLHLEETRKGTGLQVYEAILAFGSGGWDGLGLGNSRQKLGFIPFHHTDFILPVVGEELGVIATLGVIAAFTLIVICGVRIAAHARDDFGTLLATGISFLIGLQAFVNMAVVTNVLPNKGLPLPFISRGGSNLFVMLLCVGLLFSIARQARAPEIKPSNPFARDEAPSPQPT
jgi:cell division protein FtsW